MDFGHVKISRKAYASDPFWTEERPFSRWEAWEWMIQAAAWKPYRKLTKRSGLVELQRGETPPLAERFLADAWGWGSKNRARRFLELLEEMGRIRPAQRTADGTTYLLVNYDSYQSTHTADGPQDEPEADQSRTSDGPVADQNRSSKAVKAVKQDRKARPDEPGGQPAEGKPSRTKRASVLPDSWSPSEKHAELAKELGLDLDAEAEKFRDWILDRGMTSKDWEARFRNWLRKAAEIAEGRSVYSGAGGSHLSVIAGGQAPIPSASEVVRRRAEEDAESEAEYSAWRSAVSERFAALTKEEREAWKNRVRALPDLRALEGFPTHHDRLLRQRVYELFGETVGLPYRRSA